MSQSFAYSTFLPGGQHWSLRVRKGTLIEFIAEQANTNVGLVMFNPENLHERLNLPDSLKCQHTVGLTRGNCLYSDMGRIFASIVEDDLGWHDSISGSLTRPMMVRKGWQPLTFQQALNERTQAGFDSFITEIAKYGLNERDLPAPLNLFSKVAVDEQGGISYVEGHCAKGARVTLRFEMDTLIALHSCPHPLDPAEQYPHRGVSLRFAEAAPVTTDDPCYQLCAENRRGFQNNRLYSLGFGAGDYLSHIPFAEASA
ncbi:urea amidolyase associated protein UAAP1 [Carnimonas bestiolae]|uniref:urea amidolyase associated protein UAAP1 n=1 Tax=Carnimonas bestiolae TaxID=3402172 RepID=UPI003EDC3EE1